MLLRGELPWTVDDLRAIRHMAQGGLAPSDMARQPYSARSSGAYDRALDALFARTPEEALAFANRIAAEEALEIPAVVVDHRRRPFGAQLKALFG